MTPALFRRCLLSLITALAAVPPDATAGPSDLIEAYANGDHVRLFYVRAGTGPLMLFLHGAPDDWSLYESQLKEFSEDHLVVAPNLRGFAPSDQPGTVEY